MIFRNILPSITQLFDQKILQNPFPYHTRRSFICIINGIVSARRREKTKKGLYSWYKNMCDCFFVQLMKNELIQFCPVITVFHHIAQNLLLFSFNYIGSRFHHLVSHPGIQGVWLNIQFIVHFFFHSALVLLQQDSWQVEKYPLLEMTPQAPPSLPVFFFPLWPVRL